MKKENIYILKYGKYKGYEICYASRGQIFPRDGWYIQRTTKSGTIKDIKYIEELLT